MVNYTVWFEMGNLGIDPAIGIIDGEPVHTVFLINDKFGGEVYPVNTKKDAIHALYDEHQVSDVFKDGDTFTFRGESRPFAFVEGVHVLPVTPGWEQRVQYQLGQRHPSQITASQEEYEKPIPKLTSYGEPYSPKDMKTVQNAVSEVRSYIRGMEHIVGQYDWSKASPPMVKELRQRLQMSSDIISDLLT